MKMRNTIMLCSLVLLLTGCLGDSHPVAVSGGKVPVEVMVAQLESKLSATRAMGPIDGWSNDEVYMAYGVSDPGAPLADPADIVYSVALKGFISNGVTVFEPLLFYPESVLGLHNMYLRGFYPREGVVFSDPSVRALAGNKVAYKINGSHDIMMSNYVTGSGAAGNTLRDKFSSADPLIKKQAVLHYEHMLSQLSFRVMCDASWPSTLRITAVRVTGVATDAVLDFSRDLSDPAALSFAGPHDGKITVYENTAGMIVPTDWGSAFGNVMIESLHDFALEVTLSSGDVVPVTEIKSAYGTTINRTGDDGGVADDDPDVHKIIRRGYHYRIDLTFTDVGVKPTVALADWDDIAVNENGNPEQGWW